MHTLNELTHLRRERIYKVLWSNIFVIVSIGLQFGEQPEELAPFANFSGYEFQ
jgi:hypothetical protein